MTLVWFSHIRRLLEKITFLQTGNAVSSSITMYRCITATYRVGVCASDVLSFPEIRKLISLYIMHDFVFHEFIKVD